MSQDSATSTPPPLSTPNDSMPIIKPSPPQTQQEFDFKEKENKEEEPNLATLEPNPPFPLNSEPNKSAEYSERQNQVTTETVTSEPADTNIAAEVSKHPHLEKSKKMTEDSEKQQKVTAELDSSFVVVSEPSKAKNTADDDSERPEMEPAQKLILEQRKKYTEVTDWTEPVPPDAALLEAAASEPEQKQPSQTECRSLAEMMHKEETQEEKPKIRIPRSLGSFKEETSKISDLSESELNALHELRNLLQESANSDSIWGVPLQNDVVLLKFLRARDFKPQDAYSMLTKTLQWRVDFNIEELLDENLVGDNLDKVVFMQGHDRENHPVCYNVYGEFQNKDLYQKTFSDEEKRQRFLRWRIQFLEKSIRNLDFVAGGVSTICQVNDLKNSPGPGKTELRLATKQALHLLQDNYPEFVSKQIFINVPWWYLAFYRIISPFMSQRSKSKLVFAGPSRSSETLFKYISPEHVPVQYGGLSVHNCDCNSDFTHDDIATEITVKPSTKQTVEIIIYEKCTIVWEIRVVGWEFLYGAEFVPERKEGYTVIIQKPKKMSSKDEPVVSQSFKVGELGKILLTVDNPTSTKKMLIYRFKVKPLSE